MTESAFTSLRDEERGKQDYKREINYIYFFKNLELERKHLVTGDIL